MGGVPYGGARTYHSLKNVNPCYQILDKVDSATVLLDVGLAELIHKVDWRENAGLVHCNNVAISRGTEDFESLKLKIATRDMLLNELKMEHANPNTVLMRDIEIARTACVPNDGPEPANNFPKFAQDIVESMVKEERSKPNKDGICDLIAVQAERHSEIKAKEEGKILSLKWI
jgi:hypothetical protein